MTAATRQFSLLAAMLMLLSLLVAQPVFAQAGKAIFVSGQVNVERGTTLALNKGDDVLVGDTIVTGDRSRAQLEMADGARVAIRPNSRYRIDEFVFEPEPTGAAPAATAGTADRSVSTLIKGGFRTITGLIGQEDETEYEVHTPIGTLGIRGTDYTAVWCSSDCVTAPGVAGAGPLPDGLYLGVSAGTIFFRNSVMTIELHAGQYAYIPAADAEAEQLLVPPAVFYETPEADFQRPPVGSQTGRPDDDQPPPGSALDPAGVPSGSSFQTGLSARRSPPLSSAPAPDEDKDYSGLTSIGNLVAQPILATDPSGDVVDLTLGTAPPQPGTIAYEYDPPAVPQGFVGSADNLPGEILNDAQGNPIQFRGTFPDMVFGTVGASFNIGSATNVDTGFDAATQLRWGRWSGGVAQVLPDTMSVPLALDLSNQSLHWIDGADRLNPPVMPQTGQATYSLIGSTSPTDNQGNVGVMGSASFSADFTNQTVASTVDVTIAGSNWVATGNGDLTGNDGSLPSHQFDGTYTTVTIDGMPGGFGIFQGFFTGPGSTTGGLPAGAGLTYSLSDPLSGRGVGGALAFGNPQ